MGTCYGQSELMLLAFFTFTTLAPSYILIKEWNSASCSVESAISSKIAKGRQHDINLRQTLKIFRRNF